MKRFFVAVALLLTLLGAGLSQALAVEVEDSQRAEFEPPIMIVNTSFLNIRTGPSSAYPILLTVVGGTELPVLGSAGDGVWYQVSTIAGVGWVNSQHTIARGDFRNVPLAEAPEGPVFDPEAIYGDLDPNTSQGGTAAENPFGSGRAWGISVTITHPARTRPTITSTSPGNAVEGYERVFPLLSAANGDGTLWYQTTLPSLGTVWIEASKARLRPYACELTAVIFAVPVRPTVGPDGSGSLDGEILINMNEEAYLLDAGDGVFKIELFDGSTGWVRQEDVLIRSESVSSAYCESGGTDTGTAMTDTTVPGSDASRPVGSTQTLRSPARAIINTAFLNVRSGPGSQYSLLATVPGGNVYDITGWAPDGVWWRIYGDFGSGWVNSEFVIMRGTGTSIPVVTDFGSPDLARPLASVTNAVTMYATPNSASAIVGALSGPSEYDIVARTADSMWVQLDTPLGFGWVATALVAVSGDVSLAPVVAG